MSYLGPIPGEDPVCEECGASQHGPARPYGGHVSFCGLFSAQRYLDDQRADALRWAEDAKDEAPPEDFTGGDALAF